MFTSRTEFLSTYNKYLFEIYSLLHNQNTLYCFTVYLMTVFKVPKVGFVNELRRTWKQMDVVNFSTLSQKTKLLTNDDASWMFTTQSIKNIKQDPTKWKLFCKCQVS